VAAWVSMAEEERQFGKEARQRLKLCQARKPYRED
jgi:hypothetical protein